MTLLLVTTLTFYINIEANGKKLIITIVIKKFRCMVEKHVLKKHCRTKITLMPFHEGLEATIR